MKYGKAESLDFFGNGIIRADGKCCFIKNALPREEVIYVLEEEKKRFARGRAEEIVLPSPRRRTPPCPVYGSCGGCDFQHVEYALEADAKEKHVFRALKQIAGVADFEFLPLERPRRVYGYRNNVTFHMREGKTCFYRPKTHDHIAVSRCELAENAVNEMVLAVNEMGLTEASSVTLRCDNTGGRAAVIYGDENTDFSEYVRENGAFTGILAVGGKGERRFGDPSLFYSVNGRFFSVLPRSFFQIHTEAAETMLRFCAELLLEKENRSILDLYCGVGSIGISLAAPGDSVFGIEIVPEAAARSAVNAAANGVDGTYRTGKTEHRLKRFLEKIPKADVVILDPPRQGLQKDTAKILADYGAETLLYISCDPASLSRDLIALKETYAVRVVKPFDLFPRTSHVETVVLMSRKDT